MIMTQNATVRKKNKQNEIYKMIIIAQLIYGEERKANIFENCTCQQVNKAKNFGDKQRSP